MKKLIRLIVACTIKHEEKYYQVGLESMDVDYRELTHSQISAYKAGVRIVEADMLIDYAFHGVKSTIDDVDCSFIKK